jgi:hypothetical protein
MSAYENNLAGGAQEVKVPRRDWILLPFISLVTLLTVTVTAEVMSRHYYSESETHLQNCLVLDDKTTGVRGIPNCDIWEKFREAGWVHYQLDCAGYRTGLPCGPKPTNTYRIVMLGSSIAMGEGVPMEETLAALLPQQLSTVDGRRVEVYNEAMGYGFPKNTVMRFDDVLAAKPDVILWVLTLVDVKLAEFVYPEHPEVLNPTMPKGNSLKDSIIRRAHGRWQNPLSATGTAVRHFLYQQQPENEAVASYLKIPPEAATLWDPGTGPLRMELSEEWNERLTKFEGYAAEAIARANDAGVPLVAVLVPGSIHAAMISMGEWPAGFDPYRLNEALRSNFVRHGGEFIDILASYRSIQNPERYYFPVDGHPDEGGHRLIAALIAKQLRDGPVAELRSNAVGREPHLGK